MERTTRYFSLATRLLAETGAHIIKTYYCENFEQITAACPVPIVIAGGKKIPEKEALEMAYRAVSEGYPSLRHCREWNCAGDNYEK